MVEILLFIGAGAAKETRSRSKKYRVRNTDYYAICMHCRESEPFFNQLQLPNPPFTKDKIIKMYLRLESFKTSQNEKCKNVRCSGLV